MPRFQPDMYPYRLLRDDGRRRRLVAHHRRLGLIGGRRRFDSRRHGAGGYRARRHGTSSFRGPRRYHHIGAGPANHVAPLQVPSTPLLGVDRPPPPFCCSTHGWVVCPLHAYGTAVDLDAVGQSPTSVFEFGGTSSAAAIDANVTTPRQLPPTPAVVEMEGDALAYVSAPTDASSFVFASGADGSHNHTAALHVAPSVPALEDWLLAGPAAPRMHVASAAALPTGDGGNASEMGADGARADESASLGFTSVDVNTAAMPLPSPTPATPPPSPRLGARRRLVAFGLTLASPSADSPTSSRGHRAGSWNPAALGLANGACNGNALGTMLHGGSEDEDGDERGGSFARRR